MEAWFSHGNVERHRRASRRHFRRLSQPPELRGMAVSEFGATAPPLSNILVSSGVRWQPDGIRFAPRQASRVNEFETADICPREEAAKERSRSSVVA